jgi:hypothetical protein
MQGTRRTDSFRQNPLYLRAGVAQSAQRLATGWTVQESNPGGGEIFRTRPYQPWSPPSPLYSYYRVSFPGVKRSGRDVDHPAPSSTEVIKERAKLYVSSLSAPSMQITGWTLALLPSTPSLDRVWPMSDIPPTGMLHTRALCKCYTRISAILPASLTGVFWTSPGEFQDSSYRKILCLFQR